MASGLSSSIPLAVFADSYKATHPLQYPPCDTMVAYGEFRSGYNGDASDTRVVHYGIRHLVETYLHRKWTEEDLKRAGAFFETHAAGGAPLPWPRDLFTRVVRECGGYFPIRVQALREGTCAHARVPAYQITARGDFAPLCLFFETVLTHVWYPSTVATLSRRARDVIEAAFERGADAGAASALVPSRLHDFGMRGCCTGEQAVIGGCAHLLSFDGSDTMPAAFHAQFHLNGGRPVASSIPATVRRLTAASPPPSCARTLRSASPGASQRTRTLQEHSVMTAWPTERAAILNMIAQFGEGAFACVMDSYDYIAALEKVLPSIKSEKVGKGGYMVLRPDSGDPTEAVLQVRMQILRAHAACDGASAHASHMRARRSCVGAGTAAARVDIDLQLGPAVPAVRAPKEPADAPAPPHLSLYAAAQHIVSDRLPRVQGLRAADEVFGHAVNGKGFKVINGCGVIQGDGINIAALSKISEAVLEAGYSPENVAYGMGAGLLQKINRDTMAFATKLDHIRYADGTERDVMKCPKTDSAKMSFPGVLGVKRIDGVPTVFPEAHVAPEDNMLEVVYDCGPVEFSHESFDDMRTRVRREWCALPRSTDPLSAELKADIERVTAATRAAGAVAQDVHA